MNHHRVVDEIIRTKRYDTLPLLLPLLPLDENNNYDERFAKIYAQALLEEDEETIKQLTCLGKSINFRKVCFWYGALTTVPKDLAQVKREVDFWIEYLDGLISVDNLELFLIHQRTASSVSFGEMAGRYCACKVMDHFGYTPEKFNRYLFFGLITGNKETVIHLSSRTDALMHAKITRLLLKNYLPGVSFVRWLLQEKYYCPTEDDWTELKNRRPDLYAALQADV